MPGVRNRRKMCKSYSKFDIFVCARLWLGGGNYPFLPPVEEMIRFAQICCVILLNFVGLSFSSKNESRMLCVGVSCYCPNYFLLAFVSEVIFFRSALFRVCIECNNSAGRYCTHAHTFL